jgi:DNA repair exonuclease SbcCD ATPase subunit
MSFDREKFDDVVERFQAIKIKKLSLEDRIESLKKQHQEQKKRQEDAEKSLIIIQIIAQDTQQNLEFHISNLVTTAIQSVDPSWPEFVARIVIRRNRTECDLLFKEHGVEQRPQDSSGGGPKDVASFALRISYWSLKKNRNSFLLDEPFRNVSPDLQERVSDMVKMVSEKLNIQIIMISHQDEINIAADKTFFNVKKGKVAKVTEI